MNEKYGLALTDDDDFDQPHAWVKDAGDGSPPGYCRCLREKDHEIHALFIEKPPPEFKRPGCPRCGRAATTFINGICEDCDERGAK